MARLTENEVNAFLRECTHYSSQSRRYTRLLGFSQLSQSKRESGKQKFTGIVQELHDAANEEVISLTDKYTSRKQVQQAVSCQRSALQKITDNCLEPYGPKIWGNGQNEPFVTHMDQYYRQRLIWDNMEDQKRYVQLPARHRVTLTTVKVFACTSSAGLYNELAARLRPRSANLRKTLVPMKTTNSHPKETKQYRSRIKDFETCFKKDWTQVQFITQPSLPGPLGQQCFRPTRELTMTRPHQCRTFERQKRP
jgi:hypothetical protein